MNPIHKEARLDFIDLLKAIAIYFVVIYHFNKIPVDFLKHNNPSTYFNYFVKAILSTSVPIFFFVNGFLLLNKNSFNLKNHIFKTLKIIYLTTIWSTIILTVLYFIRTEDHPALWQEFITNIFIFRYGWNNHLWFMGALVVIYIFYPLLHNAYKNNIQIFYFFFACVISFTFINVLIGNILTTISFFSNSYTDYNFMNNYGGLYNPFLGIPGYALGYFMLGGIFYTYQEKVNTKKLQYISIVGLLSSMLLLALYGAIPTYRYNIAWDNVWNGYDMFFTLFNVVFIVILTLNYKAQGKLGQFITLLGENSLGIFFIHFMIGWFLKPMYFQLELSTALWANIIFAFLILIISLFITVVLKKIPGFGHLFRI